MEQRQRFVALAMSDQFTISDQCEQFGISRKTGHKWIGRYTRSPFGFEFGSEAGKSYVVEATSDLREWGVVKSYNGTGTLIRFEDERDQVFSQIYYRVRVVE